MVKHTQTIRRQFVGNSSTNCLSVFDHFVKLALKGLKYVRSEQQIQNGVVIKVA